MFFIHYNLFFIKCNDYKIIKIFYFILSQIVKLFHQIEVIKKEKI